MSDTPGPPATSTDAAQARTQTAVEQALDTIHTARDAEKTAAKLAATAADLTCAEAADQLTATSLGADPTHAAAAIAHAAESSAPQSALVQAAAQLQGADAEARNALSEGVFQAANPQTDAGRRPHVVRARSLLRSAMLRRLRPLDALDAALFLRINHLPHPPWANALMHGLSIVTKGGKAQVLGLALAACLRPRVGARALAEVLPPLWLATAAVEFPIKRYFRRRRPFLADILAVVVGRRPGSYSFPSGHTAAAFAFATLMRRRYPRGTAWFYGLAALVGFARVYLGAHYPGDVLTGAVTGTVLATACRPATAPLSRRLGNWLARRLAAS